MDDKKLSLIGIKLSEHVSSVCVKRYSPHDEYNSDDQTNSGIVGQNHFAYTNNSLLTYTDPTGHSPMALEASLLGSLLDLTFNQKIFLHNDQIFCRYANFRSVRSEILQSIHMSTPNI